MDGRMMDGLSMNVKSLMNDGGWVDGGRMIHEVGCKRDEFGMA
jgi:hypothetical protein